MGKLMVAAALLLVAPALALARSPDNKSGEQDRAEAFAGYAFSHASIDSEGHNLNGWGLGVSINVSRHFGVTAELSDEYGRHAYLTGSGTSPVVTTEGFSLLHLLGGPRFVFPRRRATAFAQVLAGSVRQRYERTGNWPAQFAMGFGGGVDVPLGKHLAYRAFQADYIRMKYTASSAWYYAFRLQTGVVLRFGGM